MGKMREEFEAWFNGEYGYFPWRSKFDGDDYATTLASSTWEGWKASRAALCVDFPESIYEEWEDQLGAFEDGACMMTMQLDDVGVKVNGKPDWYDKQVAVYKNKPLD